MVHTKLSGYFGNGLMMMVVVVLLALVLGMSGCSAGSGNGGGYAKSMNEVDRGGGPVGLEGRSVGEVDGRGTLREGPVVTSTAITESAGVVREVPSVRAVVDGRAGDGSVNVKNGDGGADAGGDGGVGDVKVGRLVDDAFDMLMAGDASGAVEKLTEAQTIPGWAQSARAASVLYWLGQSYERLDERMAAMASYRKMLRLYPDSVWARRARKRLTALESGWSESGYGKNGA